MTRQAGRPLMKSGQRAHERTAESVPVQAGHLDGFPLRESHAAFLSE